MLRKAVSLGGLFGSSQDEHPLADIREIRRIVATLPADNAFRALDEVVGVLEAIQDISGQSAARLFESLRLLDEAGQPYIARLSRDYLLQPRLSKSEEKRLWSMAHGFWSLLAAGYERCLSLSAPGQKESLKEDSLALLCARLIVALGAEIKWTQFHYSPASPATWGRLGQAYMRAERAGLETRPVPAFSLPPRLTSVQQEYVRMLAIHAASMDSLLPLEIDLAEKLIAHFLSGYTFSAACRPDCVYWVDPAASRPPMRLVKMPDPVSPTLRFFQPGNAPAEMAKLLRGLEMGHDIPPEINLGARHQVRTLLPVLRHLVSYLSPVPPQRRHDRHRVKHRMSVLNGLVNAFVVFSGEFGGRPAGLQMESWVVDNVSRGGFGASLNDVQSDWLKIGVLLAMQPEGGDNWLLGIVRRFRRESEGVVRVGIETLARQAVSVELRPRAASSYAAAAGIPALWLQDGHPAAEIRLVLPPASFDLRERVEFDWQGKRLQLEPVALAEHTADYEVARYRITA